MWATDQIDHIKPLSQGGKDVDSNCQGLCHFHHAVKTAAESASAEGAANHPLRPRPALRTIVCVQPCAGKSTYVGERAAPRDAVIDLDLIMAEVQPGFVPWQGPTDPAALNRAIRVRNAMLGSLANKPARDAWFVVGAPTHAERLWWHAQLGGAIVLLEPAMRLCEERAVKRGTPAAIVGIRRWYAEARRTWSGPAKRRPPRQAFGPDGYPI